VKTCAVIATHHKTGTVWMRTIFEAIAKALKVKFVYMNRAAGLQQSKLKIPSIVLNDHSDFSTCAWMLDHPSCRILHLIRDPRDMVLSAMHYHRTAQEPWLHKAKQHFGGLTYQQKINSLPDDQSRYFFEMRNSAKRAIRDMRGWDYSRPNSMECRYEDLIADSEMKRFTEALTHLGFEEHELEICKALIRQHSLFGDLGNHTHVRSGEARQWKSKFNKELAEKFLSVFGDVLIELGYEKDNQWVGLLTPYAKKRSTGSGSAPAEAV
jgi:hypothetical protein